MVYYAYVPLLFRMCSIKGLVLLVCQNWRKKIHTTVWLVENKTTFHHVRSWVMMMIDMENLQKWSVK